MTTTGAEIFQEFYTPYGLRPTPGWVGGHVGLSNPPDVKINKMTNPAGHVTEYHYNRRWGATDGQLVKQRQRLSALGTVLRETNNTYVLSAFMGTIEELLNNNYEADGRSSYLSQSVVAQDGNSFTTEYDYDVNPLSTTYSYGNPIQTRVYSDITVTPRVTDITYEHNRTAWVLGLTKSVNLAGTNMATYTYDGLGRRTAKARNGQTLATYGYHTTPGYAGRLYWIEDGLGNRQEALNYKRGRPQQIRQWLNKSVDNPSENRWLTESFGIDDNGWLTSRTDALGHVTAYGRDNMGRTTLINPPGGFFNNTTISYNFAAGGATPIAQTLTQGTATTIVRYDTLLRPQLIQQTTPGWSAYSQTQYDVLGRTSFQSRPSATASAYVGTATTYDALDRVTRIADTANPSVYTDFAYWTHGRLHETRPNGEYSTRWTDGYGPAGTSDITRIDEPGRQTFLYRDVLSNLKWLRQLDTVSSKEISQFFTYNAQQRLCAHYVPEQGETRYTYDAAGRVSAYARGMAQTATYAQQSCAAPSGTSLATLGYDSLGRLLTKDFADGATRDVDNFYDDRSSLRRTRRLNLAGGAGTAVNTLSRTYGEIGQVLSEVQTVVGAPTTFSLAYSYDANGFMNGRTYPSNQSHVWTNDGFGHQLGLTQGGYTYASALSYHPDGSLAGYTAGNGQAFTRSVDALQRTSRLRSVGSGLTALDLTYGYNANSRAISIVDASTPGAQAAGKTHSVSTLQYDTLGQLSRADGWWGVGTFTHDRLGNLLTKTLGTRTVNYGYRPDNLVDQSADSLLPAQGGTGHRWLAYDVRGNVRGIGLLTMVSDMTDQLVSISGTNAQGAALSATYQYNGEGKRVLSTMNGRTNYHVYDHTGALVMSYKVADGEQVERVSLQTGHPLAKWTGAKLTYLHSDHLGTPIRGTHGLGSGTTGAPVFQEFYTPFGLRPTSGWNGAAGSSFTPATGAGSNCGVLGFTTHVTDCESGFTYMQARYYDPVVSRFMSGDPVTFMDTGQPTQFNRYAYVGNDPINMIDPDGRLEIPASTLTLMHCNRSAEECMNSAETIQKEQSKGYLEAGTMVGGYGAARSGIGLARGVLAKGAAKRAVNKALIRKRTKGLRAQIKAHKQK